MRVAIASSGLGHVSRGIETWAYDTAHALKHHGVDTTLFAAAPVPHAHLPTIILPARKRNDRCTQYITRLAPRWTWRWHLKSSYEIEQVSFWMYLSKHLDHGQFDILHVQDPLLAKLAQQYFQKKKLSCKCILAHGTEEPASDLEQFTYLQHLAPWHMEQTRQSVNATGHNTPISNWTMLPNFVDTARFQPVRTKSEKATLRSQFRLPHDAIIWGTAAAIKKHHKRIDWLLQEFAAAATSRPELHLVIAGSQQQDTYLLMKMAEKIAPGKVTFLVDLPHAKMPDLLQTLDAFVLTSLFEMMPIAILEAISTGLCVYTHNHPVLTWMTGPGGCNINMQEKGELQESMQNCIPLALQQIGQKAREYAIDTFSVEKVIPDYIAYYHEICNMPQDSQI